MKFFVTICFLSGATNQLMIHLCHIRIKTGLTDLLIENWRTWTVKDTLWTICYPAISQIFILYPPHIYSMTMSELLSVSSHATMIMNDCKCHGLAVKVFWSYVQGSGFNPQSCYEGVAQIILQTTASTDLQCPQNYYRCNNYVFFKVCFCLDVWTWCHKQSHLKCLIT